MRAMSAISSPALPSPHSSTMFRSVTQMWAQFLFAVSVLQFISRFVCVILLLIHSVLLFVWGFLRSCVHQFISNAHQKIANLFIHSKSSEKTRYSDSWENILIASSMVCHKCRSLCPPLPGIPFYCIGEESNERAQRVQRPAVVVNTHH